ncbi:MAG TPA: DUF4840 domain-containing protein [Porphyromonadaceae bacterium]|nr:DUF4840 domain-containing protein [Porphyromonadaceae bacterium]
MRKESKLKHLFVSLMILGCSFGYTACSSDDDPAKEPALTDVYGEYSGKMVTNMSTYAALSESTETGIDITATVNNDTVSFAKFPVDGIIQAVVPEGAEAIIENLGDIKYVIEYEAEFNAAKDSIFMTFAPEPLELFIPIGGSIIPTIVKVEVSADTKGKYAIDDKNLIFAIKATSVTVNGTVIPFPETQFIFNMNKK